MNTQPIHIKGTCFSFLLFFSFLLCSCSTLPASNEPPATTWPKYQTEQQAITHWNATGTVRIRFHQNATLAHFQWQQNTSTQYKILFYGPLGMGQTLIQHDAHAITLTQSDGRQYKAATAQELMEGRLGWYVPVNGLYDWARGLPTSAQAPFTLHHGRIKTLNDQGWHIHYQDYHTLPNSPIVMPYKMTLTQGPLSIKMVFSQWTF